MAKLKFEYDISYDDSKNHLEDLGNSLVAAGTYLIRGDGAVIAKPSTVIGPYDSVLPIDTGVRAVDILKAISDVHVEEAFMSVVRSVFNKTVRAPAGKWTAGMEALLQMNCSDLQHHIREKRNERLRRS